MSPLTRILTLSIGGIDIYGLFLYLVGFGVSSYVPVRLAHGDTSFKAVV